jgi:hypothetical protein
MLTVSAARVGRGSTGTTVWPPSGGGGDADTRGFAYADTLLYYTARAGCAAPAANASACATLLPALRVRRALHPLQKWDDPAHARLANWP